jgi:hypothetical protein
MTLSLADLQQWEPEQIEEVGDALAQRARTSGQTAETLRNLQVFEKWDGEASAAAKEALEKSATKLGVSAQEAFWHPWAPRRLRSMYGASRTT